MENDISSSSVTIGEGNSMVIDPTERMSCGPHVQQTAIDSSRSYIMPGYPLFSTLQAEPVENLRRVEHFVGPPLYSTSLDNLLAANAILVENLIRVPVSATSASPFEELRTSVSMDIYEAPNLPMEASGNCGDNGSEVGREFLEPKNVTNQNAQLNCKWNYNEIVSHQAILGEICQSYRVTQSKGRLEMDYPYGYHKSSDKHSLSLETCKPSIIHVPTVPDQGLEISCSGLTQVISAEDRYSNTGGFTMGLGSEQISINSKEVSLDFGFPIPDIFPHVLLRSKYLHAANQMLVEIVSSLLRNVNDLGDLIDGVEPEKGMRNSSSGSGEREVLVMDSEGLPSSTGETKCKSHRKLTLQRQELETKKADLLDLMEMVDHKYNQYFDQIQMVFSSFKVASGCDPPQLNHPFALRTLSKLFKNLRERINNQILLIGEHLSFEISKEKEKKSGSSFIKKQWDMQRLKRAEQQSWRPQRGLPEKSISILRSWLFENFLHPYPKDTEKHLLARRSGLTRSQVSNWFINARVRLWKPMIEEMYYEIKKKDSIGEGTIKDQTVQ